MHNIEKYTGVPLQLCSEVVEEDVLKLLNRVAKASKVAKMRLMDQVRCWRCDSKMLVVCVSCRTVVVAPMGQWTAALGPWANGDVSHALGAMPWEPSRGGRFDAKVCQLLLSQCRVSSSSSDIRRPEEVV